jgi:iron complex transport system substrate-binding protein
MKRVFIMLALACSLGVCSARTVTDDLGRVVTLPEHPHRLICLLPSIVDDVYALGAGEDVIAVSDFVKYPAEARNKRSVGLPLSPSFETIVVLHPDLVLADGGLNNNQTIGQLEKAGITVFYLETHGLEGVYKSIFEVGMALNRNAQAHALVERLHARVAAVRQRVQGKPVVSILMPIWYDPILTIGRHAYITELIQIAGGRSVTDDLPGEWPQIGMESVMARAPQGLLLIRGSQMSMDQIRNRPGWQSLAAIRNNRVYYTDERLELPSPVAFYALEELAKQLHP